MTRKLSKTLYDSALAGLANYNSTSFNFTITSHSLPTANVTAWNSQWPLNNANAISAVQINYSGVETVWRPIAGASAINVPYVGTQYQLETITYYSGGNFKISTYVINETGGTITIPLIIVNVRIFLYNAPF